MENRLEEIEPSPHGKVNNRYVSTTDPEAGIVRQGRPKLYYKTHRVVEECSEIITAVEGEYLAKALLYRSQVALNQIS